MVLLSAAPGNGSFGRSGTCCVDRKGWCCHRPFSTHLTTTSFPRKQPMIVASSGCTHTVQHPNPKRSCELRIREEDGYFPLYHTFKNFQSFVILSISQCVCACVCARVHTCGCVSARTHTRARPLPSLSSSIQALTFDVTFLLLIRMERRSFTEAIELGE